MTFEEAADRLAIRELVDAYAHCADRRDCDGQMALFTEDARLLVFMDAKAPTPSQTIIRRADLRPVFENLLQYEATTHFNGQGAIALNGPTATGESSCLAHHVQIQEGRRRLMIASIRYLDTVTNHAGRWLFSKRRLMVDWVETRSL